MSPAPAATVRRSVKASETSAAPRSAEAQPPLERTPRVSSIAEALSRWLTQQL
jgi:hypothetical protein